jgi:putative hydrolase of the HAD superfamily
VAAQTAIQVVVFDIDDTLYPERQYVRSGYRAVGRHLRDALGTEAACEDWLWNRFLSGTAADAFDALNEHFSLGLSGRRIAELVRVYREHRPEIRPYDGAADMLARLRPRFRLGILSDGFLPAQRLKLEALGIERFFDVVIYTEEMGREAWKPSTAGFEAMRERFDLPHAAFAYVADNPAKDFVAPNSLYWRSIQFVHPGQIHARRAAPEGGAPHYVVHLPGEVLEALLE